MELRHVEHVHLADAVKSPFLAALAVLFVLRLAAGALLPLSTDEAYYWLWSRHLSAVVVSQRVGYVKPRPEIFEAAARELGVPSGPAILHVGDDLGADVVGAQKAGWRAAWVRMKPEDSPLPTAPPAPEASTDLGSRSIGSGSHACSSSTL